MRGNELIWTPKEPTMFDCKQCMYVRSVGIRNMGAQVQYQRLGSLSSCSGLRTECLLQKNGSGTLAPVSSISIERRVRKYKHDSHPRPRLQTPWKQGMGMIASLLDMFLERGKCRCGPVLCRAASSLQMIVNFNNIPKH